jgi:hypothetical protein
MIIVGAKGPKLPGRPDMNIDDDWEPEELGPETMYDDDFGESSAA